MSRNSKFEWQTAFLDRGGMKGSAGFIAMAMSTKDNGDGQEWWVTQETLAAWTGLSTRSVKENLAKLKASGWIVQVQRGGNHGGKPMATTYRLAIPPDEATKFADPSPGDLKDGDYVPAEWVASHPELEERFTPAFGGGRLYCEPAAETYAPAPRRAATQSENRAHRYQNASEGLDELGEPLVKDDCPW